MTAPLKLTVLGCSATTTGELTLALDWVKRCTRPLDLTIMVSAVMAPRVQWAGHVVTYPTRSGFFTRSRIRQTLKELSPDVLLIADMLLLKGVHYEIGVSLDSVVAECMVDRKVVGLDLYDWDTNAARIDCYGECLFADNHSFPFSMTRLMPSPYLPPGPSTPGRGRYAMMEDGIPLSNHEKQAVREELGLGSGKVVLVTTSPWQDVARQEVHIGRVATHFPALLLRLLDHAVRSCGPVTLAHLGPMPWTLPDDVHHVVYRHIPQMPPAQYHRLLGVADLVLTGNCVGTSVIRAASMRVPAVSLFMGQAVQTPPELGGSHPQQALSAYLKAVCPTYAFRVWPMGWHRLMNAVMQDNPFRGIQVHLDVMDPDGAVEGLRRVLVEPCAADELRQAQERYFSLLTTTMGSADQALDAVLE